MLLNKNTDLIPYDAIYIGRGSKWGNPFKLGIDGSRIEVIDKYEAWLKTQPGLISDLHELCDQTLVCFCKPKACHGDVLIKIMTMTDEERKLWLTNSLDRSNFFDADGL